MNEELKKLHEEIQTTWRQMKEAMGRPDAHTAEVKASVEKMNADIAKLEAKYEARLADLETKMNRPQFGGTEKKEEGPSLKRLAFELMARKGVVGPEEAKGLIVSDDTTGGYLAPSELVSEIIKGITEMSPVREVARIRSTSSKSVKQPKRTGQFAAAWVGEIETRTESTGLKYGMEEIPTHEMTAKVVISQQDLEDSAYDFEAEIRMEAGEQFGVAEGNAFILGNGVKKPEGMLTIAGMGEVVSGHASQITADGLIDLFYELKDGYAKNASFLLKRSTIKAIRKLKDGNNQYLWSPGLSAGQPASILDRPYKECVDMPAIAAGTFPVLFGDFRRGYTIVDRVQISMQRDPYSDADNGNVILRFRKRVGGQVMLLEAIKKLKISA